MRPLLCAAAIALALATVPTNAQTKQTENTVKRAADADIPVATVADMAWLAGRWTGEGLGGWNEEIWSPPAHGVMMGMYRMARDGKTVFYEFLLIRETERGLAMRLKHFHPDLTAWEEKEKFVEFLYVGKTENRIYFEGLTFERASDDRLQIYLALRGKDGGVSEQRFTMTRE